jgi:hypothetical protein
VTLHDLVDALAQYKAGLEAGIELLRRLEAIAIAQQAHAEARDYERLAADADIRGELTRALVAIEPGLREIRTALSTVDPSELAGRGDYDEVRALRALARDLVARVVAIDETSLRALSDAELARRATLASLETGEHTLAAYRRVLAPPVKHAALLDYRT